MMEITDGEILRTFLGFLKIRRCEVDIVEK